MNPKRIDQRSRKTERERERQRGGEETMDDSAEGNGGETSGGIRLIGSRRFQAPDPAFSKNKPYSFVQLVVCKTFTYIFPRRHHHRIIIVRATQRSMYYVLCSHFGLLRKGHGTRVLQRESQRRGLETILLLVLCNYNCRVFT